MSIKVNIHPGLYHFTDDRDVAEVEGTTVGQCLDDLIAQFPEIKKALFDKEGKLLRHFDIYVNKENTYPELLIKPVKDGDELHILVLAAGG